MIESKERRKIERNNLIDIHFSKTIFLFSFPTLVSSVKIRVNIYNRTVKSVPRADIQLILNSFGKSAPGEMQISHSDLGQNREQLKLKLKYISKQKAVLHIVRNTKPQVAVTMKIFLMDFIHAK